ncbi:hypothetical protein F5X99DRAFT_394000 [Biscogniauxia marginata]|nr:hypothetical protein F5X99DRAFT_394000 [Biscogniauxia marginata]
MSSHSMSQSDTNVDTAPGSNGHPTQYGNFQRQSSQIPSPDNAVPVPVSSLPYYNPNGALSAISDPLTASLVPGASLDFANPSFPAYGSVDPLPITSAESHLATTVVLPRRPSAWGSITAHSSFQARQNSIPVIAAHQPQMRYLHSDLAVLSAEHYDDARVTKRPGSVAARKAISSHSSHPDISNPKKRGRKPSEEGRDEVEEETKRARGRPRLDTADQTPSERRRTQIRLAQRAYRNRKETAITELEAKVTGLKEGNQEIRNAYQHILDYATQHGILAQVPEFGRQLQDFQELLVKKAEEVKSPGSDEASPERELDKPSRGSSAARKNSSAASTWTDQSQPLYAGVVVSHEPEAQGWHPHGLTNHGPAHYDIITEPTAENASFASNVTFETSFLDSSYSQGTHSPWSSLPVPSSMAINEWTLSRRLHRRATERAVDCLMSPNPNPAVMNRVFGFVRLFETMEEIRTRMLSTLARMRDEPLNNWKQPFHHVGGSGTHYSAEEGVPTAYSDSAPFPNSGFGIGPFNEPTMRVRDGVLSTSQYVSKQGWQGTWFDAYDVETYLLHNGIILHVSTEVQSIELPPDSMFQRPRSAAPASNVDLSLDPGIPMRYDCATYPSPVSSADGVGIASVPVDDWQSVSAGHNWARSDVPSGAACDSNMRFSDGTSQFLYPPHGHEGMISVADSKRVLLNVHNFIEAMISRASCLGRAPCFRPTDVITAFWESVIES